MSTSFRVRPQPCTRCGEKIVIVESRVSSLGGLWRLAPRVAIQHADYEPVDGQADLIDNECRRESSGR
jgi:hypothetical protein